MLEAKDQGHNFAGGFQKKRSSRRNGKFFVKLKLLKKKTKVIELETEVNVKFSLVIFLFNESKNSEGILED